MTMQTDAPTTADDANAYTGEDLLRDVYELVEARLPRLPKDDPTRPPMEHLLIALAPKLENVAR